LQFTRVLDTYEFGAEPEDDGQAEPVDREYWEKKTRPESLAVVESINSLIPKDRDTPRVTYNKYHIVLGTSGYNFCWFYPRSAVSPCQMHVKVEADKRQEIIERLEEDGIDADNQGRNSIRLRLTLKDIDDHKDRISELIKGAEEWSQR
jgi:hypothetical protein